METELFSDGAYVLKIYTAEKDHMDGLPFYEWISQRACAAGIAGVTVIRGLGGFCSSNPVLSPAMGFIQINRPVIVEIVDGKEDIEKFVREIDDRIPRGLMTLEPIKTRFYGRKKK